MEFKGNLLSYEPFYDVTNPGLYPPHAGFNWFGIIGGSRPGGHGVEGGNLPTDYNMAQRVFRLVFGASMSKPHYSFMTDCVCSYLKLQHSGIQIRTIHTGTHQRCRTRARRASA